MRGEGRDAVDAIQRRMSDTDDVFSRCHAPRRVGATICAPCHPATTIVIAAPGEKAIAAGSREISPATLIQRPPAAVTPLHQGATFSYGRPLTHTCTGRASPARCSQ